MSSGVIVEVIERGIVAFCLVLCLGLVSTALTTGLTQAVIFVATPVLGVMAAEMF